MCEKMLFKTIVIGCFLLTCTSAYSSDSMLFKFFPIARLLVDDPSELISDYRREIERDTEEEALGDLNPISARVSSEEIDFKKLADLELKNHKSSALLEKAFIEKKDFNDFLVLQTAQSDEFAEVIPNDIYYNTEKKCVNWLDDCSVQGLQSKLLKKIGGPYR